MPDESSFPIPTTISAEAQAILAESATRPQVADPEPDDDEGWHRHVFVTTLTDPEVVDALALATTGAVPSDVPAIVEEHAIGDARYYTAVPEGHDPHDERVLFVIHGGGFAFGGGLSARRSTEMLAGNYGMRVWGMDYRQLPDYPFPFGLDDCMTVYRALIEAVSPSSIAIVGQSGGANLSAALMLRARDEGLPLPAVAGLISPPIDLTGAGDTHLTNGFTLIPGGISRMAARYAGSHSLTEPYISPLFGDFTPEFPPTILTAGTRDFLLSDTVRMHRKLLSAGVEAELHVWEGAPHGLFMGRAPEDREQVEQVRAFFERHLPNPSSAS